MGDGDGDDDFDRLLGVGAGGDGSAAGAALLCDACGSDDVFVNALGEVVCLACGTQSQDVRALTQEEGGAGGGGDVGGGIVRGRSGGAIMRRARRLPKASAQKPLAEHALNTGDFLEAVQRVLVAQTDALGRWWGEEEGEEGEGEAGAGAAAAASQTTTSSTLRAQLLGTVGSLWSSYLRAWAGAGSPPVHLLAGRLALSGTALYVARLYAEGTTPPPLAPLTPYTLVGALYVATRWLSLPVLPHDICRLVRAGRIPFANAASVLAPETRALVRGAEPFFVPTTSALPDPSCVERAAFVFARTCGLDLSPSSSPSPSPSGPDLKSRGRSLPPVSLLPAAALLAARMRAPPSALAIAASLEALDAHDRAHAQAYTRFWVQGSGGGAAAPAAAAAAASSSSSSSSSKSKSSAHPGRRLVEAGVSSGGHMHELERLRAAARDTDGGAGVRVAALLYVAVRLCAGWEAWVDEHLAPGMCCGGDGPVRGGGDGDDGGEGGGGTSGGPVPRGAEELASLGPSDLARAAQVWSRSSLSGGDVVVGAGVEGVGYGRGDFGASVTVAVTDATVARMLRGESESEAAAAASAAKALQQADAGIVALLTGGRGGSGRAGGGPGSAASSSAAASSSSSAADTSGLGASAPAAEVSIWLGGRADRHSYTTEPAVRAHTWAARSLGDVTALSQTLRDGLGAGGGAGTGAAAEGGASRGGWDPHALPPGPAPPSSSAAGRATGKRRRQRAGEGDGEDEERPPPPLAPPLPGLAATLLMQPRLRQPIGPQPTRDALRHARAPRDALRPHAPSTREHALLLHLCGRVEASPDQLLLRADALELLLQLYTPMPRTARRVTSKAGGRRGRRRRLGQ
jgi:hypothetical protein